MVAITALVQREREREECAATALTWSAAPFFLHRHTFYTQVGDDPLFANSSGDALQYGSKSGWRPWRYDTSPPLYTFFSHVDAVHVHWGYLGYLLREFSSPATIERGAVGRSGSKWGEVGRSELSERKREWVGKDTVLCPFIHSFIHSNASFNRPHFHSCN